MSQIIEITEFSSGDVEIIENVSLIEVTEVVREIISGSGSDITDLDDVPDSATRKAMTATERIKLNGIADGATANSSDPTLLARANHTGTQPSTTISDFTEAVQDAVAALLGEGSNVTLSYNDAANTLTIASAAGGLDAEAVRDAIGVALIGIGNISVTVNDAADTITISTTATVNSTDAALRDRSTHTGTQAASTISDFQSNVSSNTDVAANTSARHTHSNKALLDTYTQTEANLADAVSKKHSHSNLTALNAVEGVNTGDQDISGIATNAAAIGTLANLDTDDKTNLVDAINEVKALADAAGGGSVPADGTITNAKLATDVKVGSLATLNTTNKTSVTAAINELNNNILLYSMMF